MPSLQQKVTANYVSKGGKFTFPWASILQIIKDLLGGCTTNMAAQRWARRNEVATKEALVENFKGNALFRSAKDRQAAVDATYEGFIKASRVELRQLD